MRLAAATLVLTAFAADAHAQSWGAMAPPAIEAVASVTTSSDEFTDPFVFLDLTTTWPIGNRFGAVVRPYAHRLAGGEWEAEMYQLQLRYQSQTAIPVRVDAGIITSPLGLGTLELRPDVSPAIKTPFYYYMPLPAFEPRHTRTQLMSGGYPIGAIVSASGAKWDARAGMTDSTPARPRESFEPQAQEAMRQFVAGGGVSPVTGLRVGAGFAQGAYRSGADVTVLNLEGEYAIGHTRFSGEWIRNRFESTVGPAIARGYYVQAVQTFGPRVFGTVRLAGATAPAFSGGLRLRRRMTTAEVSAGYRLGHDLTVRGGYYASRHYNASAHSHTAVVAVVWSRRFF